MELLLPLSLSKGKPLTQTRSAPTIIKLARLDVMTIKAQISEADITRISVGQSPFLYLLRTGQALQRNTACRWTGTRIGNERWLSPATVQHQAPELQNASVYYNALFDDANPENRLRIAMTAPRLPWLLMKPKIHCWYPFRQCTEMRGRSNERSRAAGSRCRLEPGMWKLVSRTAWIFGSSKV